MRGTRALLITVALSLAILDCSPSPATPTRPAEPAIQSTSSPTPSSLDSPQRPTTRPSVELTPIRFGLVSLSSDFWPIYVGLDEGIFLSYGLAVELIVTRSGPDGMGATLGGSIDINSPSPELIMLARAIGADPIAVAGL